MGEVFELDKALEKQELAEELDRASIKQVSFRLFDRIHINERKEKIGEKTGFNFLDKAIYGAVKTFLYIVGAYTSVGKTALMTQLTANLLKHNSKIRIAIFSTEPCLA